MRILHVTTNLSVAGGGHSRACAELCESLSALGLDITLVHMTQDPSADFHPQGVHVHTFQQIGWEPGSAYAYSREMREALKQLIPRMDLVHIHGVWRYQGWAAARVASRCSLPYIVQPHGSLEKWRLRHKRMRKLIYGLLFERWVLAHAHGLQAESELDRQELLRYLPGANVFVVPCGAYPAQLNAPTSFRSLGERWPQLEGHRVVLFLSRLDFNKGVDLLLHAFHAAGAGSAGWRLLIVGPDYADTKSKMQKLAGKLRLNDYVVWAGLVSEEERRLALQKSDFYVLPSLSENFGISILEALFCGRPVITTTKTPWDRLDAAGAGFVVHPDVGPVTAALRKLLALPKTELDAIGRRGLSLVKHEFDWATVARRQIQIYERTVSATSVGRKGQLTTESASR